MAEKRDALTNQDVRTNVIEALAADPRTAEAAIEVIAEQGVVTLRGQVEGQEVREAAEEVVASRAGVVEVINDLSVEPPESDAVPDVNAMAYRESRPPIVRGPK
jgi:osmotically-inducible protein OsmY